MTKNLKIALAFLSHYPEALVFPAVWDGKCHQGKVKWGSESSGDPEQIKQWARKWPDAYFCLNRVPSGFVILDIDVKKDKEGDKGLAELLKEHGPLPETLIASTPSGGRHYLLTGAAATCYSKLAEGIDIPVMIPLPGSEVKGKGVYGIEHVAPIAAAPEWIASLAGLPAEKAENREDDLVELDQPRHIAEATLYLSTAPGAIEGAGGDAATYNMACRVRDFGLSEETSLDLMARLWNPRCQPPWDFEELQTKVQNAYRYAQDPSGKMTAEAAFKDVPLPPRAIGRDDDAGPRRFEDYVGDPPDREWIIEDWLPTGEVTSLYGHGGLGKSLLAVQIGHSISHGVPFLGLPITTPMSVLGIFAEDSDDELHRRLHDIKRHPDTAFTEEKAHFDYLLWSRAQLDSTLASIEAGGVCRRCPFYERLVKEIEKMPPGPKFLILDTLADLFAGQENDREAANKFVKVVLGSFIRVHNCTVLLLAHPSLSGMARKDGLSGSTAWNNAVRNRLVLSPHKSYEDYRLLTRAKSNYARSGEALNLMWENGTFKVVNMADVVDETEETNKNIIMDAIATQAAKGVPYGTHGSARLNIHEVRILDADGNEMDKELKNRLINELIKDGDVERVTGSPHRNGLWPIGGNPLQ